MAFALSPDGGYPRLIRWVTLEGNTLATLDRKLNLLRIDRAKYDRLSESDQRSVIITHSTMIVLEESKK